MYIRVQAPDVHLSQTDVPKAFTTYVIKFGMAYDLHRRHVQMGDDNGFYAFEFPNMPRPEADIVERILRYEFTDFTVFNSFEYVDASSVALKFKLPFNPESYESYINIASRLYAYMVSVAKNNWPDRYNGQYGHMFSVVESISSISKRNADNNGTPMTKDDFSTRFDCRKITDTMAPSLGLRVDPPIEVKYKVGMVICRHWKSGRQVIFTNSQQASNPTQIAPRALKDTYIGKSRIFKGCHWRMMGSKFWKPSSEYQHDPSFVDTTKMNPIMSTSIEGVVRVYDSRNLAAKMLKLKASEIKHLHTALVGETVYLGATWRFLPAGEFHRLGTWHDDDTDHDEAVRDFTIIEQDSFKTSGEDGRCNGKIMGHNLSDGTQKEFASKAKASQHFGVHCDTIDAHVDQPRQIQGYTLYGFTANVRWAPNDNFRYNIDKAQTQPVSAIYIVAMAKDGSSRMYEGATSAAFIMNPDAPKDTLTEVRKDIMYNLGKEQTVSGFKWRKAEEREYMTFIPIAK
jgi:hypothetical protein